MYDVAPMMRRIRDHVVDTAATIELGNHDDEVVTWGPCIDAIREDHAEIGKAMTKIKNYAKSLSPDGEAG